MSIRIGFVGTRFAGTDGVSLESNKWAQVLAGFDCESYWFAGKLDRPEQSCAMVPQAHFANRDIEWISDRVFGTTKRNPEITRRIYALSDHLKDALYKFRERFEIDVFVAQNALTIPMNIPLGLALTNFIAETEMPTLAHHHDFYWERDRFSVNAVEDLMSMAFPPALPSIQHATINSAAQRALSWRKGISSILIPNVLDFANAPPEPDSYSRGFRESIGLSEEDIMFLQPTRVVPRKGIEFAVQLLAALDDPRCKLVISHESGDEGHEYLAALQEMAEREGVDMRVAATQVGENRTHNDAGKAVYTLADAYTQADFITYPSLYEGFGNALLEAFYFRKPVLVNRYSIYIQDIEPKGFQVAAMSGYLTNSVIEHVRKIISDPEYRQQMVETNYQIANRFFSFAVLRRKLQALIRNVTGTDAI